MTKWKVSACQLGMEGKEGITYTATNSKTGEVVAVKQFKSKTAHRIKREGKYQKMAAKAGLAPKVYKVDVKRRQIVMEKMDRTLLEVVFEQKGKLTHSQQRQIFRLYQELYVVGLSHNDASALNIMEKDGVFKFIDFGFSVRTKESQPDYHSIKYLLYDEGCGLITKGMLTQPPKILEELYLKATGRVLEDPEKERERIFSPRPPRYVTNPLTKKKIKIGGKVYKRLKLDGVI